MQAEEYRRLFEQEETHWWYRGLRELVLWHLQHIKNDLRSMHILDAGCGAGFLLKCLADFGLAVGIDLSPYALQFSKKRGVDNLIRGSISYLPIKSQQFDVIISLDVLYHKAIKNDVTVLKEFYRVLKPKGKLILNLPAFECLRGAHDLEIHTARRYTGSNIRDKLDRSGFQPVKLTYRNSILFPVLFMKRGLERCFNSSAKSDLDLSISIIDAILEKITALENRFIRYFNLPIGSSIFCIAQREE